MFVSVAVKNSSSQTISLSPVVVGQALAILCLTSQSKNTKTIATEWCEQK